MLRIYRNQHGFQKAKQMYGFCISLLHFEHQIQIADTVCADIMVQEQCIIDEQLFVVQLLYFFLNVGTRKHRDAVKCLGVFLRLLILQKAFRRLAECCLLFFRERIQFLLHRCGKSLLLF